MAVVTVRNLDETTRDRLKTRAATNGRSMEAEVRAILQAAVEPSTTAETGLGSRISALFAGLDLDGVDFERVREPSRSER